MMLSFRTPAVIMYKLASLCFGIAAMLSEPLLGASPKTTHDESQTVVVDLVKTDQGFQLLRDGRPYFIKGAGGDGSRKALVAAGGNSLRTWGADKLQGVLDEAQQLGLTVAVGIWLGHERHGFDY